MIQVYLPSGRSHAQRKARPFPGSQECVEPALDELAASWAGSVYVEPHRRAAVDLLAERRLAEREERCGPERCDGAVAYVLTAAGRRRARACDARTRVPRRVTGSTCLVARSAARVAVAGSSLAFLAYEFSNASSGGMDGAPALADRRRLERRSEGSR